MKATDSFENCPKCGAEVDKIQCGSILVESCPNCKGLFLDYNELLNQDSERLTGEYGKQRADAKELDVMTIRCPKCKSEMKKKIAPIRKKKLILDICPGCKGIWFDKGELEEYRKSIKHVFTRPIRMHIRLVCTPCGINVDYDPARKDWMICPRCHEWMDFEGVGEVLVPRLPKEDIAAMILFPSLMAVVFIVSYFVFRSTMNAVFFTGTLGLIGVFVLIRALVYNRFAWQSGFRGYGVVKDFSLSD